MSSNERIVRIPATTSAPYTTGSSRVNIRVPSSLGVVDMEKSYLEASVRIPTVDGNPTQGEGVYNVNLNYKNDTKNVTYNVALVKNCKLMSENVPLIEETQDVNFLRSTLNHYHLRRDEKKSLMYNSLYQEYDRFLHKGGGVFRLLNGDGEEASENVMARIPIKLSQLYGMGKLEEVDLMKTGDLNIQVDLDINNIKSQIIGNHPAIACDDINNSDQLVLTAQFDSQFDIPIGLNNEVQVSHGGGKLAYTSVSAVAWDSGTKKATLTLQDATTGGALTGVTVKVVEKLALDAVGGDVASFTLAQRFQNLVPIPFWVSQKVLLSQNNGVDDVVQSTIKSISRDALTGVVTIVLNNSSGGALTNATLRSEVPAGTTSSIEYLGLDVVLVQKFNKQLDHSGGYRFLSYVTEKTNGNKNTSFSNSYKLPPSCVNSMFMFNDQASLYSVNQDVSQYRVVLDDNLTTDRPVIPDSPLYYDELSRSLMNNGEMLGDLNGLRNADNVDLLSIERDLQFKKNLLMIPNTIPLSPAQKIIQYEVEAPTGNGVNNAFVFKQLERSI